MSITKIPSAGLEDTGVTAGTRGSSSEIPIVTVNSKGQVTQMGGAPLDLSWTGISGRPTALSQFTNNLGNYGGFIDGVSGGSAANGAFNWGISRSGNTVVWNVTNCNCCCCLSSDTEVLLADGTYKKAGDLVEGDVVMSENGAVSVEVVSLAAAKDNSLWKINGVIVATGNHLFMTENGWAAVEAESEYAHGFQRAVITDLCEVGLVGAPEEVSPLTVGSKLLLADGTQASVTSIERVEASAESCVVSLALQGADAVVLRGGVLADAFFRVTCESVAVN